MNAIDRTRSRSGVARSRIATALAALGFLATLALADAARAQPPATPATQWQQLSPAEQRKVRENYERWKRLPPERRGELVRRHEQLESAKLAVLATQEGAPAHPRTGAEIDRLVREFLERRRGELLRGAGFTREQLDALPLDEIERLARERAAQRLQDLVRRGVIDDARARALLELPPPRLAREMRKLHQEAFLASPPPEFEALPAAEKERLRALAPEPFFREIKRLPKAKASSRAVEPLRGLVPPLVAMNPRQAAARRWLDLHLAPEERERIAKADPVERRRVVLALLKRRAREALAARGEDLAAIEEVDQLPKSERSFRLIQLIDPGAELGPPTSRQ